MRRTPTATELIEIVERRSRETGPLGALEAASRLRDELAFVTDQVMEHFVASARQAGQSWTAIGERLGVSKQAARQRFIDAAARVDEPDLEVRPRLQTSLEHARDAAARDGSPEVGGQHLLLGLMHTGVAATALDDLGVSRERVVESIGRLFEVPDSPEPAAEPELSEDAAEAIEHAKGFARERGSCYVGTEHLLCVLVLDPGSAAHRVLNDLGVNPADVKRALSGVFGPPRRRHRRSRRTA